MPTPFRSFLAGAAALSIAACSGGGDGNNMAATGNAAAAAAASGTLATALGAASGLDKLHDIAANAGLNDVLNGTGPYTLFAPNDAAIEALGSEPADALEGEAMRPQAIALLRAHIVPGAITRADLDAALARDGGAPVTMRTMAGGLLTFARDGETIRVTSDNGASARLTGAETLASNGAIHPVDALLLPREAPAG